MKRWDGEEVPFPERPPKKVFRIGTKKGKHDPVEKKDKKTCHKRIRGGRKKKKKKRCLLGGGGKWGRIEKDF